MYTIMSSDSWIIERMTVVPADKVSVDSYVMLVGGVEYQLIDIRPPLTRFDLIHAFTGSS
jgi:hypothetical protein